ncbi:MAG: PilT/PilU family type 4a pilus ATPase [Clostridiales bacterium]|nr:PilT/PilU family type 4a pilus ATPase [Clostridiales bacterium]
MDNVLAFLNNAVETGASDLFIVSGLRLSAKIDGVICAVSEEMVMPDKANQLVSELYSLAERSPARYLEVGDDDFSLSVKGLSRFRVSTYKQRGSMAAVIRVVRFDLPDFKALGIPDEVLSVSRKTRGLVLVTGPAGNGKSTTLAYVVDAINSVRNSHIITIEDPIEFLHRNKKSVVSQREINVDTESYITALRACLRQAPDVILLGEMRDLDTIRTAMTAAETGHLVISTLHTVGAVNTIDRIIDVFPPGQQQQIRIQLSMVLQTVISQQLVLAEDGKLHPVFEIMHLNSAIRNMIRDSKIHQIDAVIQSSSSEGMVSMDASIFELYKRGTIASDTAVKYAYNVDQLERRIAALK